MSVDLSFRQATQADLAQIVSMLADDSLGSSREDASLPLNDAYVTAFEAIEQDQNQLFVVAVRETEVVGCLQLSFIPGLSRGGMWRGQIESVRVARESRGLHIGQQLFSWAIEQCALRGCGLVQLTSDKSRPDALEFYRSLGFQASHEGFKLKLD